MSKGTCDRCYKKHVKRTGTIGFKVCIDCFNELQNDGSIPEVLNTNTEE